MQIELIFIGLSQIQI